MKAKVGDFLVVKGTTTDRHDQHAEIIEVRSQDGSPPYVVRWLVTDHEATVYPGCDAVVVTAAEHMQAAERASTDSAAQARIEPINPDRGGITLQDASVRHHGRTRMSTPASAIGMELVYEFEYFARLKPPVEVGAGPYGTRVFFEVIDGEVTGARISGRLLTGGGDWLLVGPDGMGRLDVRAQIETHDNAVLYLTYEGVIEMNERVQTALAKGTETAYEDQYFRTTSRLETGDERYAWVNQTMFVGQGRIYPGSGVQYRVYRVN